MNKKYNKHYQFFHHPEVKKEIQRLDALQDCQRIAHLLYCYEFSFDFTRALELALFKSYSSQRVSRLLNKTQQFERFGQKRIDDTALLIALFIEHGWDGAFGQRALARINQSHGHYQIHNDDFLFVLWTFVACPIDWCEQFGRRPLTEHEQLAWFNFWCGIANRMNIQNLPQTLKQFNAWAKNYELNFCMYSHDNQQVTQATMRLLTVHVPQQMRTMVENIVYSMMPSDFCQAVGVVEPSLKFKQCIHAVFKGVAYVNRYIAFGHYPNLQSKRSTATYQRNYEIEALAPHPIKAAETRALRYD